MMRHTLIVTRRSIVVLVALSFAALLLAPLAASADRITMRGTTIPLPPTTIERIAAGRVHHIDGKGRSQHIELDRVATISFTGLEELDQAEQALAAQEYEQAVLKLLQALLKAETSTQQAWIRSRLVRVHDAMEQYVEAASHLASIVAQEDHPYWRNFEPVRDPAEVSYAATAEAMDRLTEARRRVSHPEVIAMVVRMIERVEPLHRQLSGEHDGATISIGRTLSGFDVERIREGELVRGGASVEEPPPSKRTEAEPPPEVSTYHEPGTSGAIEALLSAGEWRAAADMCATVARDPGNRDLAEFLHQYGRSLAGIGRYHDAAVMFTRCAVLYPGTTHALASLIETAIVYRDIFEQPEVSLRLLERAVREADRRGDRENALRARELLGYLQD